MDKDPYSRLRRQYPDASDDELAAIQSVRDAEAYKKSLREGRDLSELERIRAEQTVKRILKGIIQRGQVQMQKLSSEKKEFDPQYLMGYYQGYSNQNEYPGEEL